ncbi:MAG: hypothetical protein ACPGVU_08420 [Limisphaerales bacterium]
MSEPDVTKSERQFLLLIQYAGAFSLGAMFALFGSIDEINPRLQFSLNWKVYTGFFAGGGISWWIIGHIFSAAIEADKTGNTVSKRKPIFWMLVFCFIVIGLTLGTFIWSLWDMPDNRMRDVIIGNVIAVWAVGFCCILVWNLVQFFEESSAEEEKKFSESTGKKDKSAD